MDPRFREDDRENRWPPATAGKLGCITRNDEWFGGIQPLGGEGVMWIVLLFLGKLGVVKMWISGEN